MTIKEAITEAMKQGNWSVVLGEPTSIEIYFENDEGRPDSTQFDLYADNKITEADTLYRTFCRENHFPENTVTEVEVYGYIVD